VRGARGGSLGRTQGGARQLSAKLKAYLRPKCYAVLLDPAVNTPATVRLNLFQARAAAARCVGLG